MKTKEEMIIMKGNKPAKPKAQKAQNKPAKPAQKPDILDELIAAQKSGLPTSADGVAAQSTSAQTTQNAQNAAQTTQNAQNAAQTTQNAQNAAQTADFAKAQKIASNKLGEIANGFLGSKDAPEDALGFLRTCARKYSVSADALRAAIQPYLEQPTQTNKRMGKRLHFCKVQQEGFRAAQWDNALLALNLDDTSDFALREFVKGLQARKLALVDALHSNAHTPSAVQGYAFFLHSPIKSLFTDETLDPEFYLVSTGWVKDAQGLTTRSYPYYGVRLVPSKNRENTNPIQYARPEPVKLADDGTITEPDAYRAEFDALYLNASDSADES